MASKTFNMIDENSAEYNTFINQPDLLYVSKDDKDKLFKEYKKKQYHLFKKKYNDEAMDPDRRQTLYDLHMEKARQGLETVMDKISNQMPSNTLKIKKIHPEAKIPTRKTDDAAGYDLYSLSSGEIKPGEKAIIPTGISMEFPTLTTNNFATECGIIASRSGLSAKFSTEVGAGIIDKDYRGEIKIILYNHSTETFTY